MDVIEKIHNRNRPMPELFRRDDTQNIGAWDVAAVPAVRGEPYISVSGRIMRVPLDDSELAHSIRAHEQVHCKVSPIDLTPYISAATPEKAIRAAEEARVNLIASQLGFPMKALLSGSEHHDGELLAKSNSWGDTVYAVAASVHTGSLNPFIAGVRRIAPTWADSLREISKEIIKFQTKQLKSAGVMQEYGCTLIDDSSGAAIIRGMRYTIELAMLLEGIASMPAPEKFAKKGSKNSGTDEAVDGSDNDDDNDDDDDTSTNPDGTISRKRRELRDKSAVIDRKAIQKRVDQINMDNIADTGLGKWNPIKVQRMPMTMTVKGAIGRKRVASNIGINPRRMGRFLTDPERRVFDKTVKAAGGVVLIDCSGSMRISKQEIRDMMLAAPGCTIIGYSYAARSDDANTFILAEKGRICDTLPEFAIGNSNDMPAIEYAVSQRTNKHAPVVWVTDGILHRNNGNQTHAQRECADFALRNKVHMEYSPSKAIEYLQGLQHGNSFKPTILPRWKELLTMQ